MDLDFSGRPFLLLLFCLVPATISWLSRRSLVARRDDAVLPERLIAQSRRNAVAVWAACSAVAVVGRVADLMWAVPFIVVTLIASGYPLRRALFDERWSLAEYVGTMLRLMVAFWGLWVAIAFSPFVARAAGQLVWAAAIALTAFLLAWHSRWPEIFRWCIRAEPFTDAPLLNRFESIAASSTAPMPRFEMIDLRGGAIVNAVALASRRVSSVIYTDALLRLLDADEATAITAHEIAHLEHFDDARLRRLGQVTSGLILLSGCVALLPRMISESVLLFAVIWGVPFVLAMAWMARDRQQNETKSDLRAVQLTGDPDALIRALTKLHAFALVPRRWDTQTEHTATHPSLARRIRAIREAAGMAHAVDQLPAPETIAGSNGSIRITFDADRLHWQESEGVVHALSYTHLTELRVDARAAGTSRLVAVESGGRRWETKLEAAEAARAQKILDRVDVRLAEPAVRSHSVPLLQIAGAIVALCAMWLGHIIVALVALGASVRSAAAFYAAAGASALGAAGIVAREAIAAGHVENTSPALLLVVLGVALLAGAARIREDDTHRVVDAAITTLAVAALVSVTLVIMRSGNAVRLYQASLAMPSSAILPVALAAALACKPRRMWRLAAVPVAVVGLMIGVAGSGTFLHAFGSDPLLLNGQHLPIETLQGEPIADFSVPMSGADVRVSPGGKRVAIQSVSERGHVSKSFAVGTPGSQLSPVEADDFLFLDDERALIVIAKGPNTIVREIALQSASVTWEKSIDNVQPRRLAFRRATGRWLVAGSTFEGRVVSVEGEGGHSDVQRREWHRDEDDHDWAQAWAVEDDTVVLAEQMFDPGMLDGISWRWWMIFAYDSMQTRLTEITPLGSKEIVVSQLSTTCTDVLDATRLVCMAFDGVRTHVVSLEPGTATLKPVGTLNGQFVGYRSSEKWVIGWFGVSALVIDVDSGRAIAIPRDLASGQFSVAGQFAATLAHQGSATRIRLYALNRP
jgi:Zn-dependent protease with chaperone function